MAKHKEVGAGTNTKELSFEEALTQLEELTKLLERGSLSLDDSIIAYEKGIKLGEQCSKILKKAESKLEAISKDKDGNLIISPLEIGEIEVGNIEQNRLFQ